MSSVVSTHSPVNAPLAAQDEAIDHYLAGLLAEAAVPPLAPTPNRAPIPFVRADLNPVEPQPDAADWGDEPARAPAEVAPMDYAVAASAWSDPLALELPDSSPALSVPHLPLQVTESELIPTALFQEPVPTDQAVSTDLLPAVSPEPQPELVPVSAAEIQPSIPSASASSSLSAWQFFQMGVLTVALPSAEIHAVLTAASLKPVHGAPAALAGAVLHQARWAPVVSLTGILPTPTGTPGVVLLGAQGLWGVAVGAVTAAPDEADWDAVQWRSEADSTTDRPWLLGIQPAARLVVLSAPALRRMLDENK